MPLIQRCGPNDARLRRCGANDARKRKVQCAATCPWCVDGRGLLLSVSGINVCPSCVGGWPYFEFFLPPPNGVFVMSLVSALGGVCVYSVNLGQSWFRQWSNPGCTGGSMPVRYGVANWEVTIGIGGDVSCIANCGLPLTLTPYYFYPDPSVGTCAELKAGWVTNNSFTTCMSGGVASGGSVMLSLI